ncbi:Dabb family protein [Luteolibacter yonseiensis]|uniref:Dabb family protein n=1 Tax=Luteolibacter yonseiensis TaxID=1144680 RepID=A0A934VBH2_9BACT|nr:Dabb family protein [Luteolibacter yonseiensis]MBK1816140.1 Dabb family protein [Luteolibacter yonseiensis]
MIHHAAYFQLKPEVDAAGLEELVRTSRSLLLKIPEVLSVRSGRNIDPSCQWQFYFSIEVDSLEKLRITLDDAHHLKLLEKWIKPKTMAEFSMTYELDPSKNLKHS